MKISLKIKLIILFVILLIEYNLPFPVHLKHPDVGDGNREVFAMSNIYLSSEQSNKVEFPFSGGVEQSRVPFVLMSITLPVGLFIVFRKKRQEK